MVSDWPCSGIVIISKCYKRNCFFYLVALVALAIDDCRRTWQFADTCAADGVRCMTLTHSCQLWRTIWAIISQFRVITDGRWFLFGSFYSFSFYYRSWVEIFQWIAVIGRNWFSQWFADFFDFWDHCESWFCLGFVVHGLGASTQIWIFYSYR